MSFLTPLILLGLGALAIPVFIHLIQRERKQVVHFPSLMFLQRIPYRSTQRRRIHNWLLLALRLAALTLIIAAFARPFLDRPELTAVAAGGAREVVLLVDRSYSMGYGDRWARAVSAARDALGGLGPSDRASLVFFGTGAEAAVRSTGDEATIAAALGSVAPGAGATRFGPALKLAQSILADSRLPRKEVVIVSDFQQSGWRREEASRLPGGVTITPAVIADATTANVLVSSVKLARDEFSGQERVTAVAALINRSAAAVDALPVSLDIDGREVQTVATRIDANGSTSVSFAPFTLGHAFMRGTVRTGADALAADNTLHFVLSPARPVGVLIVERPGAQRDASLFLRRALAVGSSPRFAVDVRTPDLVTDRELDTRALVILNDVPVSDPALARRLTAFVQRGGGLLLVAGDRSAWPADALTAPGAPGNSVDKSTGRPATLGTLDYSHPIFEVFKAPRSGDFSAARFYRYRVVMPSPSARVLARFDDGAVALAGATDGRGRTLLWTSTLDNVWNDLVLKPVFVPFLHRVMTYLSDYVETPPWLTVDQVVDTRLRVQTVEAVQPGTAAPPPAGSAGLIALTPSGRRVETTPDRGLIQLEEQGFYEIRDPSQSGAAAGVIAANVDIAESDLTAMDPRELQLAVTGGAAATASAAATEPVGPVEQERRQSVWWYLLLSGILLLAIEIVLANRLPGRPV
jgi:hypothetical protein